MKKFSLGFLSLILAVITVLPLSAKEPTDYYKNAEGLNKADLLSALCDIVGPHDQLTYGGLWDLYFESDVREDGTIWDMYSTSKYRPGRSSAGGDQCGSYTAIGQCYNREHSFPKSWFNDEYPMYTDAYHIYPTDGKVNQQRGNYPFGECKNGSSVASGNGVDALGKLGDCTFPGYNGVVFEPIDEYKGDFARSYFYMAAAYNDRIAGWHCPMLSNDSYPCYAQWAINLLLQWSRKDPVSKKELDRNEVVARHQNNRNPFIDHPELAEFIWGNMTDKGWVPGGITDPMITIPEKGSVIDLGATSTDRTMTKQITVKGYNLTKNVSVSCNNRDFSLQTTSLSKDAVNSDNGATLTISFSNHNVGDYSATITLSSSEIENTSFTVKAKTVDGIPASPAENITTEGFVAKWTNVSGPDAQYTLNLYKDNAKEQSVTVAAALESYQFTGLQHSTQYSYNITYGSLTSNTIEVSTATPIPVLSLIFTEGSLNLKAVPGEASSPVELKVYTENITDQITAKVEGPFEISFDQTNWSNSLVIDNTGESFYLHSKAIETEGEYVGTISLSTPTVVGAVNDIKVTVAAPRPFLEDFEKGKTNGYDTHLVTCSACSWKLNEAGLYKDTDRHGNKSCRFSKGLYAYLEMNEDKPNGAGKFSFYASRYGSDDNSDIKVEYSTDQGEKWTLLEEITITETTLTQHTLKVEKTGNIRFRIERTSGTRINIDDIEISDFKPSGVESVAKENWEVIPAVNGVNVIAEEGARVIIYNLNAVAVHEETISVKPTFIPLEKGIYIVTLDNERGKKIIVK